MIYLIENVKDGSFVAITHIYAVALILQDDLWEHKGIDTYIR